MSDLQAEVDRILNPNGSFSTMLAAAGVRNWAGTIATYPELVGDLQEPAATLQVKNDIHALLSTGSAVPADIAQPLLDARRADDLARARRDLIITVLDENAPAHDLVDDERVAPVFDYLAGQMNDLITRARELAPKLQGATTAAQILDASPATVEAWRDLRDLAARYDDIRRIHRTLFTKAWVAEGQDAQLTTKLYDSVALYADFFDHDAEWTALRRTAVSNSDAGEYRGWLGEHIAPSLDHLNDLEPAHRLALIAQHARPWLPTVGQFTAARNAAHSAIRAVDSPDQLAHAERARIRLVEITSTGTIPPADPVVGIRRRQAGYKKRDMTAEYSEARRALG